VGVAHDAVAARALGIQQRGIGARQRVGQVLVGAGLDDTETGGQVGQTGGAVAKRERERGRVRAPPL
jgi:hypothetical protein